ncbi:hypothetical protein WJX73_001962 [Symbiochloris irregularis]|uniref:Uncharacterized protein n=1 Tax=Symbiochloris irregularis TaxID=706552 RepID=A0AAW1PM97_9CHLO
MLICGCVSARNLLQNGQPGPGSSGPVSCTTSSGSPQGSDCTDAANSLDAETKFGESLVAGKTCTIVATSESCSINVCGATSGGITAPEIQAIISNCNSDCAPNGGQLGCTDYVGNGLVVNAFHS